VECISRGEGSVSITFRKGCSPHPAREGKLPAVAMMISDKACGLDESVGQKRKLTEIHSLLLDVLNQTYLSKKPPAEWLIYE
jgi:hypothetical protein